MSVSFWALWASHALILLCMVVKLLYFRSSMWKSALDLIHCTDE